MINPLGLKTEFTGRICSYMNFIWLMIALFSGSYKQNGCNQFQKMLEKMKNWKKRCTASTEHYTPILASIQVQA